MALNQQYKKLLKQYPEYVSKEQMRLICHISKRTARYLLKSGLVPCIDSGKSTRNYKIKTVDIVKYLQDREKIPEKYKCVQSTSRDTYREIAGLSTEYLSMYYEELFKNHPDIVTVTEIAQMTGFDRGCITGWLKDKKIMSFKIKGAYRVPKASVLQFLVSSEYRRLGIRTKKQKIDMEGLIIWYREKQPQ